jgi:hypothetical protein
VGKEVEIRPAGMMMLSNFVLEINLLFYNHDGFHQLAPGAHSSYDTAPAPVFKGLPSLLAMSHLFNALPTADAILVSTSADAILVFALPAPAEFSACLPCRPTDTVSTGPEPALRLSLSSAPARSQIWTLWTSACIPRLTHLRTLSHE